MPEVLLKTSRTPVVILEKYENTYRIQYTDPETNTTHRFWTHEANLIFPQFSELIY